MEGTAAPPLLESRNYSQHHGFIGRPLTAPVKPAELYDNEEDDELDEQSESSDDDLDGIDDGNGKVESTVATGTSRQQARITSTFTSSGLDESDDKPTSDSSSDSDSGRENNHSELGSGDESDSKRPALTAADGRVLSAYEVQRLERVRRNQEYLLRLGLERQGEDTIRRRKRRKQKSSPVEKRESLRARKAVDYSEPSTTIASIVRDTTMPEVQRKQKQKPKDRQEKKTENRMERFVYREFKSIQAHKNQVVRQAEKDLKSAKREMKYWSKLTEKQEFKERRREETQHSKIDEEKSRYGMTLKDLLKDIDNRTSDIEGAVKEYDDEILRQKKEWDRNVARQKTEHTLKTLDAFDRFPRAFAESETILNLLLLERAPRDRPPPRRSHRSVRENEDGTMPSEMQVEPASVTPSKRNDWNLEPYTLQSSPDGRHLTSRTPRNVGGWISPAFSAQIDRSWLDRDSSLSTFDPSMYVPQVGDCVLYYPIGHKIHLKYFPDTVGKSFGGATRVPLWEREVFSDDSSIDDWSSPAWISSMNDETCNYPILCRVERTCPEFPPDPYTKVVTRSNDGTGEQVSWQPPKDPLELKRIPGTPLGLSIDLRPLSNVLPVTAATGLSPPPIFSIVTFPTELDPFVVPFAWAYACHSLSEGDMARHINDEGDEPPLRIESFEKTSTPGQGGCLEDHIDSLRCILSHLDRASSQARAIEEIFANAPKDFLLRDGRFAIDVVRRFLASRGIHKCKKSSTSTPTEHLFTIIVSTLPLWHGSSVVRNSNKRKVFSLSPWLLLPLATNGLHDTADPDSLADASGALNDALRTKMVYVIEDFASRIDATRVFYHDITEDDAPSYGCAVPLMMSIEKILRRLGKRISGASGYYRSVGAVLADIGLIAENCLLYNSPDSEVVSDAVSVVSELKRTIILTADVHFQARQDAKVAEEHRYKLLFHLSNQRSDSDDDSGDARLLPPSAEAIRTPFKDPIEQDWLQCFSSINGRATACLLPDQRNVLWIPQAGDEVMYSRHRHDIFIKAHSRSLETFQCVLPQRHSNENSYRNPNLANSNDVWIQGTVAWVRGTYPKPVTKKYGTTFPTSTSLIAVGLCFDTEDEGAIVYWRPCLLDTERNIESSCPSCGLCAKYSFLHGSSHSTPTMPESDVSSLERCLSLLKRRCIRGEQINLIDPKLTWTSIQNGYVPSHAKIGMKTLPSFIDFFGPERKGATDNGTHVSTRGTSSSRGPDVALLALVELGYLPPWVCEVSTEKLATYKMASPWPKLSLELVLLRLSHRFYRHKAAVLNDIAEAYINQVTLLLSEAASRKKSPVSLKRIARTLSLASSIRKRADHDAPVDEEFGWVDRLQKIRNLHSMALVSVSEPALIELLYGLSSYGTPSIKPTISTERTTARLKLGVLLSAIAKDQIQKPTNSLLMTKIVVKCGEEQVFCSKYFAPVSHMIAERNGRASKVRVVCGGKEFVVQTEAFESDPDADDTEDKATPPKFELFKCSIVCNGDRVSLARSPSLQALVPGPLGDNRLKRVVENSIRLSRKDCEESNSLVQFLVGQPGRMNPCARCQVYHRSFYHCRVVRGHVNGDFDWSSAFPDSKGIDGLLFSLNPNREMQEHINPRDGERIEAGVSGAGKNSIHEVTEPTLGEEGSNHHQTTEISGELTLSLARNDSEAVMPRDQLNRARQAVRLANELLEEARQYSEAPTRPSRAFITSWYPVDPSDGHFIYCIVCGLSGDLLCCDGCANVVHQACVALADVPDGDWFCEECVIRRNQQAAATAAPAATASGVSTATNTNLEPQLSRAFGRFTFNEKKALNLSKLLMELNSSRPDQKSSAMEGKDKSDSVPEDGGDSSTQPLRGRRRKVAVNDPDDVARTGNPSSIPLKRRPGRPRKSDMPVVPQVVPRKSLGGRPRKVDASTSDRQDSKVVAASMPKRGALRLRQGRRDDRTESDGFSAKKVRGNRETVAVRAPVSRNERKRKVEEQAIMSHSRETGPPSKRRNNLASSKSNVQEKSEVESLLDRPAAKRRKLPIDSEERQSKTARSKSRAQSVSSSPGASRETRQSWRRTKWTVMSPGTEVDAATADATTNGTTPRVATRSLRNERTPSRRKTGGRVTAILDIESRI